MRRGVMLRLRDAEPVGLDAFAFEGRANAAPRLDEVSIRGARRLAGIVLGVGNGKLAVELAP